MHADVCCMPSIAKPQFMNIQDTRLRPAACGVLHMCNVKTYTGCMRCKEAENIVFRSVTISPPCIVVPFLYSLLFKATR